MNDSILHIHVAEPIVNHLAKAAETMEALERGETVTPYFSIGFADMSHLLAILTPPRWQVISLLREDGPFATIELALRLGREPTEIAQDIQTLLDWQILRQDQDNRISAPYSELVLDIKFPDAKAA